MQKLVFLSLLFFFFSVSSALQATPVLERSGRGTVEVNRSQGVCNPVFNRLPVRVVPSPSLRCLNVQANGDVILTWFLPDTISADGKFNSYFIYSSNNPGGPYTKLDSIFTYTTSSYTNVGANANGASKYYYVQTRYQMGTLNFSPPIDTLHSIFLTVTNPGNGTAVLNWNALANPLPVTSLKWYHVYCEHPANVWTQIDSTKGLNFTDTIIICHAFLNYKVTIDDSMGCTSVSNISGATFSNIIAPNVVVLDSVSVNSGGQAALGWVKDGSVDTKGYIIYKYNGVKWVAVDTVLGASVTSFVPPSSAAGQGSEIYGVSAFDTCMNVSVLSNVQKTLYLTYRMDICDAAMHLTWNNYINIPGSVGSYSIEESINGGPFTILAVTQPGDTTYTAAGLTDQLTYCFRVVVNNGSGDITAESNKFCYLVTIPSQPKFNYLRVASVLVPGKSVKVMAFIDVTANAQSYHFYRASSPSATPEHFASVSVSTPVNSYVEVIDNAVDPSLSSYYYSMYVVDSCGTERAMSNVDHTILLTATVNDGTPSNDLTWNDYARWLGDVSSYNIYRAIDGVWNGPIANVPFTGAGTNKYSDNVSAFYPTTGKFEYFVQALEGPNDPYGFADTSNSNVVNTYQNATFYIPNAFKPAGIDKVFMPVWTFVDISDYSLEIFDRWGLKVFSTTDKNTGWDGTLKGKPCEMGAYVYLITYKTSIGEYVDRNGTVTLYR